MAPTGEPTMSPCCFMCVTTLTESNEPQDDHSSLTCTFHHSPWCVCVFCTRWCEWSTNKGKELYYTESDMFFHMTLGKHWTVWTLEYLNCFIGSSQGQTKTRSLACDWIISFIKRVACWTQRQLRWLFCRYQCIYWPIKYKTATTESHHDTLSIRARWQDEFSNA